MNKACHGRKGATVRVDAESDEIVGGASGPGGEVTSEGRRDFKAQKGRGSGESPEPLLEVRDFAVSFVQYSRGLRQKTVTPISDLSVSIYPGQVLAVVGESGSGKSLLAHAILGILPTNALASGTMRYGGELLTSHRLTELRGKEITIIPQSVQFLNPLMKVGAQIPVKGRGKARDDAMRQVLDRYRLPAGTEKLYPFQLSGGMARRVLVAAATVGDPRLIIADEPTPGLDAAAVGEALGHLRELADSGCAVMLITHDLEQALAVAERVAVFYAGETLAETPARDFSGAGERLRHPYSRALWRALPMNEFAPVAGNQPPPYALPAGCLYSARCDTVTETCRSSRPETRAVRGGWVKCHNAA